MLKRWVAERYTRKRDDEVWSIYEMGGARKPHRVNWMHAAIYRDWDHRTGARQGYLLLSTETLIFQVGIDHVAFPLRELLTIEWDGTFETLTIGHLLHGVFTKESISLGVPGQGGPYGFELRKLFAAQLAETTAPIWDAQEVELKAKRGQVS